MSTEAPKSRENRDRNRRYRSLRRSLGRITVLVCGVGLAQMAHGVALGEPNPDPSPPDPIPYPGIDPIMASEAAGQLAGSSSVTPSGQYTYRLPIDVPPGRAGVQPGLALTYTSGAGNGHLGVGFRLEGLSEIRRCPKTRATEGFPDGIDFDEEDSFCLDGQKLRQLNSDDVPNGHEGAEYRVESDTFARILAHGDTSNGPDGFTVQAKSGQIFEYQKIIALHRFEGGYGQVVPADLGEVRAAWLISEARDRSGNRMRYEYDVLEDPSNHGVEVRVKTILYTDTHDGKAGKRRVQFHYTEERDDATFQYESGVRWNTGSLLDKITLHGPNPVEPQLLGEYRLDYEPSPDTARSLLSRVRRCDNGGVCLRAKEFGCGSHATQGFR